MLTVEDSHSQEAQERMSLTQKGICFKVLEVAGRVTLKCLQGFSTSVRSDT